MPRQPYVFVSVFTVLHLFAVGLCAETIELRFAPPSGETQAVVSGSTRTVYRGEKEQTDIGESKYRTTAEKKEDGYRIVRRISSTTMTRDGYKVTSPMLDAMEGLELVYSVDSSGQLRSIHGYDGILVNLKSKFPPALMQTLAPLFNEDAIRKQHMEEWKWRIGQYAGKQVELGDVWSSTESFPLPTGSRAELHKATVFERWTDCGGGRCLRVRFLYDSDPRKLAERVRKVTTNDLEIPAGEKEAAAAPAAEITGEGELILHPATLRIYSEKITRRAVLKTPAPSDGNEQVKVVETRKYLSEIESSN